jgi:hypothetical protein
MLPRHEWTQYEAGTESSNDFEHAWKAQSKAESATRSVL